MNIFWLYFIARVALKVFKTGEKKDERSDEEEEDDVEEGEEEDGGKEKAREEEKKKLMAKNSTADAQAVGGGNGCLGKENQALASSTPDGSNGEIKKRK